MDRAGFREFLCLRLVAAGAGSHVWVREICGLRQAAEGLH